MTDAPVRVAVVDDHEVVRLGIAMLLDATPGLEYVGGAGSVADGIDLIVREVPDVALVDERLPDGRGSEMCRDVTATGTPSRLIVLTSYADDDALFAAIVGGAAGYLLKDVRGDKLVDAIRTVASGNSLLDPVVTENVLRKIRSEPDDREQVRNLTPRQRELLDYIGRGMGNREIAAAMFLSERTVKNYVSQLLKALSLQRRAQAALLGAKLSGRSVDRG